MMVANRSRIVFQSLMASQNKPHRSAIRVGVVTLLSLVAVQALLLIPMFGLQRGTTLGDPGLNARLSIAAIAVPVWTMSAIVVQLAMLLIPLRWGRLFGRDGLVNPFRWAVLGLTALLAYGQVAGIAEALQATALIADTQQGMMLVIASLYLGTAGIIFAAWIIDRFGIGHGFWIILAAKAVIDLTTGVTQAASLMSMHSLIEVFAPFAITAMLMAITVFVTTIVVQQGARFETVAWPLLLLTLVSMPDYRKEMPEILNLFMPLTVVLIGLSGFALLRRADLLRLFLPLVSALAAIALIELYLIGTFSSWVLPLPASLLVASTAVLTALWHEWRTRAGLAVQTERHI
jgi:hypothetical protein